MLRRLTMFDAHRKLVGILALSVVTLIWGSTFVVIKGAVDSLAPGSLILARFSLAALALTPLFALQARGRALWFAGLELGFYSWLAFTTQAFGLLFTSASRSAFITAVSVVLVPALAIFVGRRPSVRIFLAALLALAGVALLGWDGAPPNRGDAWTLVAALVYAVYVLRLERHAQRLDVRGLSLTQIWGVLPFALAWALWEAGTGSACTLAGPAGAATALAGATGAGTGLAQAPAMLYACWAEVPASAWRSVAYLALAATALTTSLQTLGQSRVSAFEAALIYTSEPVWAAIFAGFLLGERFGFGGWLGASLVILAMLLGQSGGRPKPEKSAGSTATDQESPSTRR
jgi:drug/metabolite transporter (DMT)-like permease